MKKWWQYLLLIPVCPVIGAVFFMAAAYFDIAVANGEQGHPAPFLTLVVLFVFGSLTVIVSVYALIRCILALIASGKEVQRKMESEERTTPEKAGINEAETKALSAGKKKKVVWHCFIPLLIEIPAAVLAVIVCGSIEINSFYEDPSHVGFALPVGTFILALILLFVTVVLAVICLIAAGIRKKRNQETK